MLSRCPARVRTAQSDEKNQSSSRGDRERRQPRNREVVDLVRRFPRSVHIVVVRRLEGLSMLAVTEENRAEVAAL